MVTDSDRTSNGCLYPFCPVESFEHVQNFPPDGTDINGHHRTRNGFTGLETDIKRIRTDTNGLKEVLSVTHPLARCDRSFKGMIMRNQNQGQGFLDHFKPGFICFLLILGQDIR